MRFDELGLSAPLVLGLDRMGYRRAWPIQRDAIPPAIDGRDVIGLAQTGRGKTIAYLAPIVDAILRHRNETTSRGRARRRPKLAASERLRGLVICPTRELAVQVARDAETLVRGMDVRVVGVFGKVAVGPQVESIRRGCDILIGTPGRIRELNRDHDISLSRVRTVVLDEADRMLDMGFKPQVEAILNTVPAERQTLFFTATMPSKVETLARTFLREPARVEAEPQSTTVDHVERHLILVANPDKTPLLMHHFANGHGKGVVVYCGTKRRVGWVGTALRRQGIRCAMLHGDRSPAQRASAMEEFRDGKIDVLVATDVAARGLHIERVRTVINYDVPNDPEEYVHRVGRAGHGGGFGEAFTYVCRQDDAKWERVVDLAGEILVPEIPAGFKPTEPRRTGLEVHGDPDGVPPSQGKARGYRGGARHTKKRSRPGRNRSRRAGLPIAKDEKPGGGVRGKAGRPETPKSGSKSDSKGKSTRPKITRKTRRKRGPQQG